jgi:hypothetical protein
MRKDSLEKKVAHRPDRSELVKEGILKGELPYIDFVPES